MRQLLDLLLKDAGTAPRTLTDVQDTLAGALFAQGRNSEGLALREASVAKLESIYGTGHPLLADNLVNLGVAYYRAGDLARSEAALERASIVARAAGTAHAGALVGALGTLGTVEFQLGAYRDARTHLDEAIAVADKVGQPVEAGRSLRWRAIVSLAEGRNADAAADLERSRELLAPLHAPDHVTMLHTQTLQLAADFAEHGPAARTSGRCEEVADLDRRFTAATGAEDPDARMAHLFNRLCGPDGSNDGAAAGALHEFRDALAPDDYRRRLARRFTAAWQGANAPMPATAPASR
jgi:tetratricopeptide (TPR) repeat protein